MLLLKKLTESLENKEDKKVISESIKLDEKLSDNMPDWLKKRLLTTKYDPRGRRYSRDVNLHKGNIDSKNPEAGPRPSYAKARNDYSDPALFSKMLDRGINLDSVNIIEGPLPAKRTDTRLKEPNIPIFYFENGQVYVKGVNDQEEYAGDGSYKPFKYLPQKTLLSDQVKAFAYIDGNDDSNFTVKEKRSNRVDYSSGLPDNYYKEKEKDRYGKSLNPGKYGYKMDKSGYVVIPTIDKYKRQLDEIKATKIYDVIKEQEEYLKDFQQEMANIFMGADLTDFNEYGTDIYAVINDMIDDFQQAVSYFTRLQNEVDNIFANTSLDGKQKRDQLVNILNYRHSNYNRLLDRTKRLKEASKNIFNSVIDWI